MPETDEPRSSDQPKVLRDPVHNLIAIPGKDRKLILGLLDRPEFHRLRRIRQFGVSLRTYPGAEHSRWPHRPRCQQLPPRQLAAPTADSGGSGSKDAAGSTIVAP